MKTAPALPSHLFLADHLLRDVVGHHLGYNLALADAAQNAGVPASLVTHRAFDPSLAPGTVCHRIFRTDFRAAPPAWIARRHHLLSLLERWCDKRFRGDLGHFPATTKTDAVFAQMLAPRHFLQWLRWMDASPSPPVLFLHLGYRPGRFAPPEVARSLERLSPALRNRIFLVTDSEKLVGPFAKILRTEVHYLPHIISYAFPPAPARPFSRPPIIFVPGNARREKGFSEVVQAMESLRKSGLLDQFHFVVQRHDPDTACAEILRGGIPSGKGIEWIDRPLSDTEYIERLGRSDVILLPYHLDCYELRTSGIFCEARIAGKPVIASKSSWSGDRISREGGGWLVDERDVAGLVGTLVSLTAGLSEKSEEARALAPDAQTEFHRDAFVAGLLKLFSRVPHGIS